MRSVQHHKCGSSAHLAASPLLLCKPTGNIWKSVHPASLSRPQKTMDTELSNQIAASTNTAHLPAAAQSNTQQQPQQQLHVSSQRPAVHQYGMPTIHCQAIIPTPTQKARVNTAQTEQCGRQEAWRAPPFWHTILPYPQSKASIQDIPCGVVWATLHTCL